MAKNILNNSQKYLNFEVQLNYSLYFFPTVRFLFNKHAYDYELLNFFCFHSSNLNCLAGAAYSEGLRLARVDKQTKIRPLLTLFLKYVRQVPVQCFIGIIFNELHSFRILSSNCFTFRGKITILIQFKTVFPWVSCSPSLS